jgi:hypothetical protein
MAFLTWSSVYCKQPTPTNVLSGHGVYHDARNALPSGTVSMGGIGISEGTKPTKIGRDPLDCGKNCFYYKGNDVFTVETVDELRYSVPK